MPQPQLVSLIQLYFITIWFFINTDRNKGNRLSLTEVKILSKVNSAQSTYFLRIKNRIQQRLRLTERNVIQHDCGVNLALTKPSTN